MPQEPPKPSSTVTALSVLALVLGTIGLLGSFIPCLGVFAIYVSVPAIIIGVVALITAMRVNAPRGIGIAATIISMIAAGISVMQYKALKHAATTTAETVKNALDEAARKAQQQQQQQSTPAPVPAPAPAPTPPKP